MESSNAPALSSAVSYPLLSWYHALLADLGFCLTWNLFLPLILGHILYSDYQIYLESQAFPYPYLTAIESVFP